MSREVKVGLLFIIASVILWFGYNYLKGRSVFNSNQTYYSFYKNANLLVPGNQVILNGLGVGLVEGVELQNDGSGLIRVDYTIKNGIKIPKGTIAEIFDVDFLGGKAIQLRFPEKFDNFHESGDELNGSLDSGIFAVVENELTPMTSKLDGMLTKVDTLLGSVNEMLNNGQIQLTISSASKSMQNIEKSTDGLDVIIDEKNQQLTRILNDVEALTNSFANNQAKIDGMITSASNFSKQLDEVDLKGLTAELEETLTSANNALTDVNKLLAQINSGDGTIGALLYDKDMYNNLEKASEDLDKLLVDLKENPSRYVTFALINRADKEKKERKRKKNSE